ncbi:MAG: hypothetical protein ACTSU2_11575 [Promethearchaeota archaeon]
MSQFQLINDLIQNIYNRIAQLGISISNLQKSIDNLNEKLNTQIQTIVDAIVAMKENTEKHGISYQEVIKESGESFLKELKKLESEIGLKDLEEVTVKLKKIADENSELLKPETVNMLLSEVLQGIKNLRGEEPSSEDKPKEA